MGIPSTAGVTLFSPSIFCTVEDYCWKGIQYSPQQKNRNDGKRVGVKGRATSPDESVTQKFCGRVTKEQTDDSQQPKQM